MRYFLSFSFLFGFLLAAQAQDFWDLERCVRHAQATNLSMQQAEVSLKSARLDEQQAKNGRLPSVSASLNLGDQFGRTIDPTTNSFVTAQTLFSQGSLGANVNLFNGGQVHYGIAQSRIKTEAAKADVEQQAQDLALQIASAYLNVLLTEEQLKSTEQRIKQSREQLNSTLGMISAGSLPAADSLNLLAQVARDDQTRVAASNNRDLAYLNLKQLLQLDPEYNLRIEVPALDAIEASTDPDLISLKATYVTAVENQSNVKAARMRIQAAKTGIVLAQAQGYPTLSAFAQVNSQYSSQFKNISVAGTTFGSPNVASIGGATATTISFLEPVFSREKVGYGQQMKDNFGQAIGIRLDIPIYQNGRTKLDVERAKLGVVSAQVQNSLVEQQLKTDIQTAIANARAAKLQLAAARESYRAADIAAKNTQKRYDYGAAPVLENTIAQNNLFIAQNDLTTARYDYIFKLKIIDFYLGRKLKL